MTRSIRYLVWIAGGLVALFILAAAALFIFFDSNDFREEISSSVKKQTGRDLLIEGDISLDIFPWLAVGVGKSSLGNAPGFGDEPMASFDKASLGVRVLPLILRREVVVGAAEIKGLNLNLAVNKRGISNWADLIPESDGSETESASGSTRSIDISSIEIVSASLRYVDEEAGSVIVLDDVNLKLGQLKSDGSSVPVDTELSFDIQPSGLKGQLSLDTRLGFNSDSGLLQLNALSVDGVVEGLASIPTRMSLKTDAVEVSTSESRVSAQPVELSMLDMNLTVNVQPFSYVIVAAKANKLISTKQAIAFNNLDNTVRLCIPYYPYPTIIQFSKEGKDYEIEALGKLIARQTKALGFDNVKKIRVN